MDIPRLIAKHKQAMYHRLMTALHYKEIRSELSGLIPSNRLVYARSSSFAKLGSLDIFMVNKISWFTHLRLQFVTFSLAGLARNSLHEYLRHSNRGI